MDRRQKSGQEIRRETIQAIVRAGEQAVRAAKVVWDDNEDYACVAEPADDGFKGAAYLDGVMDDPSYQSSVYPTEQEAVDDAVKWANAQEAKRPTASHRRSRAR